MAPIPRRRVLRHLRENPRPSGSHALLFALGAGCLTVASADLDTWAGRVKAFAAFVAAVCAALAPSPLQPRYPSRSNDP